MMVFGQALTGKSQIICLNKPRPLRKYAGFCSTRTKQMRTSACFLSKENLQEMKTASMAKEKPYITKPEVKLLRDKYTDFDSYIFEVVFTGKTQNIRSFINQLRPPYSLRSIKVERPSSVDNQAGTNFFEDSPNSGQTDILPIIRDITSTFTIIVEYIFVGPSDLITQIEKDLSKGFERKELEVVPVNSNNMKIPHLEKVASLAYYYIWVLTTIFTTDKNNIIIEEINYVRFEIKSKSGGSYFLFISHFRSCQENLSISMISIISCWISTRLKVY